MNHDKLLDKIEKEIDLTQSEIEKLEQRKRLEDIYKYYNEDDKVISSLEAQKKIERLRKEGEEQLCIKSYIKKLDEVIDGFREGNLIVISAPTAHGKSLYGQTLTQNFLKDNIKSLWFSYEMPIEELLERFDKEIPLFYLPQELKGNTLIWVEQRIIESIVKFDTKVVFIDHLHYILDIASLGKNINVSLQIGAIMRELKRIALQYKIVIFIVAHMQKTQIDSCPTLADLRDSSFTAQEADIVFTLWRQPIDNSKPPILGNETILSVQKNRRTGKTGNILLVYLDGKLKEIDEEIDKLSENKETPMRSNEIKMIGPNKEKGIKSESTSEINEIYKENYSLEDLPVDEEEKT